MRIILNKFEKDAFYNMARKYNEETGQLYSDKYILTMLAQKYGERLKDDLDTILNEKIKDYKESVKKKK